MNDTDAPKLRSGERVSIEEVERESKRNDLGEFPEYRDLEWQRCQVGVSHGVQYVDALIAAVDETREPQ